MRRFITGVFAVVVLSLVGECVSTADDAATIDFNRQIRPILSNKCYTCHGPDDAERQAGLRLDLRSGALAELDSGAVAVVPGRPDRSELIARVTAEDATLRMPPADSGERLTPAEVDLLNAWIRQGAEFAAHWSYVKPVRPQLPDFTPALATLDAADAGRLRTWPHNEIDVLLLDRLLRDGLTPSEPAERAELIRRVSLDLTGLPPTLEEVDRFLEDASPDAYSQLIDRLLDKKSYGEHWARLWLDLARYADSAGYADDPPRTIWAYRDYVIRSLNANQPFDQFTIEQIAGDLLPDPTAEQLIATAFHRNTLTNNEGGTNDEEFRNVAIVDRVNTTLAVWMGTTIGCAQCHSHKYDPISQEEFFNVFAIFNNSADSDKRDEQPLLEIWTDEQEQQKTAWRNEIARLEKTLTTPTDELRAARRAWEERFTVEPQWQALRPATVELESAGTAAIADDDTVLVPAGTKTDTYTVTLPIDAQRASAKWTALRLEALPHESLPAGGPGHAGGNFVVTDLSVRIEPPQGTRLSGRYVRVELLGPKKFLHLAEVEVFSGTENVAVSGKASQVSTDYGGDARRANDGNTDGDYTKNSVSHTAQADNPWWDVDLLKPLPIDRIVLWNRTDGGTAARLDHFRITLLDEDRNAVWQQERKQPPNPSETYSLNGVRSLKFAAAYADAEQSGFPAAAVLDEQNRHQTGWAVAPGFGKAHQLILLPEAPLAVDPGSRVVVNIAQQSQHERHTLGRFRLSVTSDPRISEFASIPANILAPLRIPAGERNAAQRSELMRYFLTIAPGLEEQRQQLSQLKKQLAEQKPATTVPIMRELMANQRRTTRMQRRGNFLDQGDDVTAGVPEVFHPLPDDRPADRLALARWLVDENNPLTARVIANRYWEAIFGQGLVTTSEEFGSQGEPPTHPELLDWLATELIRLQWDTKAFLKTLVMSSAYRQSSRVTPELLQRDPDNRLLARGPRFRLSAEMIRDQALFVGGLLSPKMYGPPVKPPQPAMGLSAAFGSGIDWKTSDGEDRYRRGLYTTWRRSNPYPSMAAFDAPNREVCIVRRDRTNTPLQALVTLNDPVYVEASQALARRISALEGDTAARARHGFRLCVAREPSERELHSLISLFTDSRAQFDAAPEQARELATIPLGPAPEGAHLSDLAAWTVVANVLLNMDEMFLKR